jgi:hypothetical protein
MGNLADVQEMVYGEIKAKVAARHGDLRQKSARLQGDRNGLLAL